MVIEKLMEGLPRLRDFVSLSDVQRQDLFSSIDKRLKTLSEGERKQLATEMMETLGNGLIEKIKRLVGEGSAFHDQEIINQDGLACGLAPMKINHPTIRAIVEGYKAGPIIRSWNNKKASAYFPHFDAVYLAPLDIHLQEYHSAEDRLAIKYSVLFHELIHSTGAKKRLNRVWLHDMEEQHKRNYHLEEIIAEMGSGMLLDHAGMLNETTRTKIDRGIAHYARGFWKHEGIDEGQARRMAFPFARAAAEHIIGKELRPGLTRWARDPKQQKVTG